MNHDLGHDDAPRYSEEEVALILKRAAELQQFSAHADDSRSMTLSEVEKVAQEVGLSTALVRRAAREVAVPERSKQKHNAFIGGPRQIVVEAMVEGEFPVERFDLLVEAIRNATDQIGQVSEVGRSMTWTGAAMANVPTMMSISISVRDGYTRIRLQRRMDQLIGGLFGGLLGGLGGGASPMVAIGLGALAGPAAAVAGAVGFCGLVYLGCRKLYGTKAREIAEESQATVDELVRVCKSQL